MHKGHISWLTSLKAVGPVDSIRSSSQSPPILVPLQ